MNIIKYKIFNPVLISVVFAWLFTTLGVIYFEDYAEGIFIGVPVFIGFTSTFLENRIEKRKFGHNISTSFLALFIYCMGLLLFAIEGAICILMAAPFGMLFTLIGAALGHIISLRSGKTKLPVGLFILFMPLFLGFQNSVDRQTKIYRATTSVEVNASKQEIWDQLIAFSEIDEPRELIFKAGIAYPKNAEIIGSGAGAVRFCNFSTGSFVEPITLWDEPNQLSFSVKQQPVPMIEASPYHIQPAHLHEYFNSVKGQFKLTELENGNTFLEGTTWYYNKIEPEFYWSIWSEIIIHKIHGRVLNHIKQEAEKQTS